MAGTPGRPLVWTKRQVAQAAKLRDKGLTEHQVATELGLSRSTTRRLLDRAGKVRPIKTTTAEHHRQQLIELVAHLRTGKPLNAAARDARLDLQHARKLLRAAPDLVSEPLPPALQREANKLRAVLEGDDVRAAAEAAGVDPWWALFLLISTGSESMSMLLTTPAEKKKRAGLMAARRAEGATFQTIGDEFGLTHERVREILLAHGGWTPPVNAKRTRSTEAPATRPRTRGPAA